jgi:molybdopterin converting factor small subunit
MTEHQTSTRPAPPHSNAGEQNVTIRAFSFLQPAFKKQGLSPNECVVAVRPGDTVVTLLERIGVDPELVEGCFINRLVEPMDTVLNPGDRIALIPPGTPGPYRYLLGIRGKKKGDDEKAASCTSWG